MSAARDALAREVDARLREHQDPVRKEFTEGYFPSALENLGVAVPHVRSIARDLTRRLRSASGEQVLAAAHAILTNRTLEGRQVAYFLVHGHASSLANLRAPELKRLGRGMDNWTSVDTFACYLSGPAWRERQVSDAQIASWARSRDRWWRRAAVVSSVALNLSSRGGQGDTLRTLEICERVVADHDDMVVKGLSWALRSLSTRDAPSVREFLSGCEDRMHARVRREVLNKLEHGLKSPRPKEKRRKKA